MFVSVIRYEVTTVECRQITDLMIGVGPSTSWTGGIVPIATFTVFPFAPRSFQWMPSRSNDGTVSGALVDGRSNWSSGESIASANKFRKTELGTRAPAPTRGAEASLRIAQLPVG